jgi:GH18 family chitinase
MMVRFRKYLCVLGALAVVFATRSAFAQMNVAYVEVNNNALSNVGCYTLANNGTQFFNITMIFAANINGNNPNNPEIFFNPQVTKLLNETKQVKELQSKGIKVSLTLLGNHTNAGWSCVSQANAAKDFADRIADVAQKYGLDGIDIDDEYSTCSANETSMIMVAKALAGNPKFKGKVLSKALFNDKKLFQATSNDGKLAGFLNYGWEMTYGSPDARGRLQQYLSNGMSKSKLAIGLNPNIDPVLGAEMLTTDVKQNGFGGVMVFNVTRDSRSYLSAIARKEYNQDVKVDSICLR